MKLADRIILHLLKHGRKDPNEIMIPNFYHGMYEMDVFKLMSTGYVVEYEVKISRADYYNDFKKMREHWFINPPEYGRYTQVFKHDAIRVGAGCNRFFFVTPTDLIKRHEVPGHCGLMYYSEEKIITIKPAPLIHKKIFTDYKALATSLSWREDRWRRKSYKP